MSGTKIKICGLFRPLDAGYLNRAMPDYAGFVFHEKSRRYVRPGLARELRALLNPSIVSVGVFVDADKELIIKLCRENTISIAQLHGVEDDGYISSLRDSLPETEIWKAFTIRGKEDMEAAAVSAADMVLLDNGRGTGERFDWSLTEDFPRSFILAGGLEPHSIPVAVSRLHPYAVDLSSGVETDGLKDFSKISAAVAAARGSE